MELCISIPSEVRLVVSSYDLDDIVKNLQVPVTVLSVFDREVDDLPVGCVRTMITLHNPNVTSKTK